MGIIFIFAVVVYFSHSLINNNAYSLNIQKNLNMKIEPIKNYFVKRKFNNYA